MNNLLLRNYRGLSRKYVTNLIYFNWILRLWKYSVKVENINERTVKNSYVKTFNFCTYEAAIEINSSADVEIS